MGLLDAFNAQPGSAEALQLQGLLGGLTRMGGLLAQAGQFRPAGTPGPGIGDAFLGFGEGQRAGVQNAAQQAQMQQKMARQALIAKAQSAVPDDQLTPQEAAMRRALSGMPEDVRMLAGPDELPGLAIDRAKSRVDPLDPESLKALGLRPGSAGGRSAWTGAVNLWQQPDTLSPEAEAQRARIAAASRAAPSPVEVNGKLVDPRTGRVIYDGGAKPLPMNEGNAWNVVMRLAPLAKAGQLDPNSEEGRAYIAAQTVLTQPKPQPVVQPDGSTKLEYTTPVFPFARLEATPATGGAGGAGAGTTIKPPPPLTESQGNATAYLTRMEAAEKRMEETVAGGYNQGSIRDRLATSTPVVGNFLMSEKGQNYKQAQEDWVRAKLRKESGAVIAESEMAAEIKTYFPQPGDAPSTIAQKAEARRTAMDALRASTGPGMDRATQSPARTSPLAIDPLKWLNK